MRPDLLHTLQAATAEAHAIQGETYTRAGIDYTLTGRQLTDIEASEGGYEITPHGRRNRQVWVLVGSAMHVPAASSWVGTKIVRAATGQWLTLRAVDTTSDPLNVQLIAVTS